MHGEKLSANRISELAARVRFTGLSRRDTRRFFLAETGFADLRSRAAREAWHAFLEEIEWQDTKACLRAWWRSEIPKARPFLERASEYLGRQFLENSYHFGTTAYEVRAVLETGYEIRPPFERRVEFRVLPEGTIVSMRGTVCRRDGKLVIPIAGGIWSGRYRAEGWLTANGELVLARKRILDRGITLHLLAVLRRRGREYYVEHVVSAAGVAPSSFRVYGDTVEDVLLKARREWKRRIYEDQLVPLSDAFVYRDIIAGSGALVTYDDLRAFGFSDEEIRNLGVELPCEASVLAEHTTSFNMLRFLATHTNIMRNRIIEEAWHALD
jgi:hypothetical protein